MAPRKSFTPATPTAPVTHRRTRSQAKTNIAAYTSSEALHTAQCKNQTRAVRTSPRKASSSTISAESQLYVDAETVDDYLPPYKPLTKEQEAERCAQSFQESLQNAAATGVLGADLKPSHIYLADSTSVSDSAPSSSSSSLLTDLMGARFMSSLPPYIPPALIYPPKYVTQEQINVYNREREAVLARGLEMGIPLDIAQEIVDRSPVAWYKLLERAVYWEHAQDIILSSAIQDTIDEGF
jgi:hypothetical protein